MVVDFVVAGLTVVVVGLVGVVADFGVDTFAEIKEKFNEEILKVNYFEGENFTCCLSGRN